MGISEEVRSLAYKISQEVIKNYDGNGFYSTNFTTSPERGGKKDTVNFQFEDYQKLSQTPQGLDSIYKGVTYLSLGKIDIFGFTVRGRILEDKLEEVLHHELRHVYDIIATKKDSFFDKEKDKNIYLAAVGELKNKDNSIARRNIGYAIYMCDDFESRAFENGTYSYIMRQNLVFYGDDIQAAKSSSFYQRLLMIRDAYDFVINNKEMCTEIAKTVYGKTYTWLKSRVGYALKECRRQYGRAITKARKDYDWTHGGQTTITL